tara:strand:+ start:1809 stop:2519 length:711 start_codon:yes stop_codon:yes gene_type:complete
MKFNKKDLIYLVIFIITIFYFNNKTENMSNTDIKKLIEKEYKIDVGSIRNLSKLANDLTLSNKLDVPGGLTLLNKGGLNVTGPVSFLPKGSIIAWNGKTAPTGWALCNGSKGTPDLRGRFIYGYGARLGNTFNKRGGSETHRLSEAEMPRHMHHVSVSISNAGNHKHYLQRYQVHSKSFKNDSGGKAAIRRRRGNIPTNYSGNHSHRASVRQHARGSNKAHNNMPPYYVLAWIIKL